MVYTELETSRGPYMIDYELLIYMLGQCYYITALNDSAVENRMSSDGPDIYTVDVDWAAASQARNSGPSTFLSRYNIPNKVTDYLQQMSSAVDANEIERMRRDLYYLETAAIKASQALKDKRNAASDRGMRNIQAAVRQGEVGLSVATFVRDAAIDGLLLGGTIMTGGAAGALVGVAAGGGLLKGGAKYQDTSNIGSALITANVEFVVALIPGKGLTKSGNLMLVFAKKAIGFQGDVAVGIAEGKSLAESASGAAIKMGVGAVVGKVSPLGDLEKELIADRILKDQVVPVAITVIGGKAIEGKVSGVTSDFATAHIMRDVKSKGPARNKLSKRVAMGLPLRVDYAVIGPYMSTTPRTYEVN